MPQMQNTVHVANRMVEGNGTIRLQLTPSFQFRPLEAAVDYGPPSPYVLSISGDRYEISAGSELRVRMIIHGEAATLTVDGGNKREIFYRDEADRGYDARGALWTPGSVSADLKQGGDVVVVASTEPWHTVQALRPKEAFSYESDRRQRLINTADARVITAIRLFAIKNFAFVAAVHGG